MNHDKKEKMSDKVIFQIKNLKIKYKNIYGKF